MRKLIIALTGLALVGAMAVSSPASADKKGEPAESGIVFRNPAIGGHAVGPVVTDVGGQDLPILVVFGWDDAVTLCEEGPSVFNGVFQGVPSPSGNFTGVTHNEDVPVLVFDVSDAKSEEDFNEKCSKKEIVPLATGTAKQRPIFNETGSAFNLHIKSQGVVTDESEQEWKLQAFLQVREVFGEPEPQVLTEWVKLTQL